MTVPLLGLVVLDVSTDPNVVQPGFLPLIITVGLAVVIYLLYRSMKKQLKRIDVPHAKPRSVASPPEPRDVDITHPTP